MALSRTARILVAILLLSAAAFFWVNYFAQDPLMAGEPVRSPGIAAAPAPPSASDPATATPADAAGTVTTAALVDESTAPDATAPDAAAPDAAAPDAAAPDAAVDAASAPAVAAPETAAPGAAAPETAAPDAAATVAVAPEGEAAGSPAEPPAAAAVATDAAPPVVVVDAPITLARDVVIADLPFLITSPPAAAPADAEAEEADADAARRLAAARATVNPFSPVVVRVVEAPMREVPTATPIVTEVAVPAEPGAIAGPRVTAPTPEVRPPNATVVRELPRALPTGTPLSATPDLLRQPRTAVERVDVTTVAAIRLPEPEAAMPADIAPPRVTSALASTVPDVLGPGVADPVATVAAVTGAARAPLAAGTNLLSRYLRDNGYTFTGSALGPVSVGVFRSNANTTPVVVAIGQTLPDTEIVLTDLRGQQAELTLGDTSQILVLDLRR
jgi:hypothetical protein